MLQIEKHPLGTDPWMQHDGINGESQGMVCFQVLFSSLMDAYFPACPR